MMTSLIICLAATFMVPHDSVSLDNANEIAIYHLEEANISNDEDTISPSDVSISSFKKDSPYKFKATELIVPGTLIALGSVGLTHWWKKEVNQPIKEGVWGDGHHKRHFDDYLMFLPTVAGYGMNLCGVRGLHDPVDATILYATTYILVAAVSLPLKFSVESLRPNKENARSFPSGHTAVAFAGAELLRKEYWHVSPWIGVGGYAVAVLTGYMRLYNNAHWFNDVLAGAGIGILSAQAAYWLYPVITKALFKKRYNSNVFISPSASRQQVGLSAYIEF